MSSFDEILSPDLEGVLRDLARHGSGSLLAVDPQQVVRTLRQGWSEVSVAQAGLSSAERHLLEAHRAELAWVLREAYLRGFYADESRSWRARYGGDLAQASEVQADAARLLEHPRTTELGVAELLGSVVGGGGGVGLLEASLRCADR